MKQYVKLFESWVNEDELANMDFNTLTVGDYRDMNIDSKLNVLKAVFSPFNAAMKSAGLDLEYNADGMMPYIKCRGGSEGNINLFTTVYEKVDIFFVPDTSISKPAPPTSSSPGAPDYDHNIFDLDYTVRLRDLGNRSNMVEIQMPLYLDWLLNVKRSPASLKSLVDLIFGEKDSDLSVDSFNEGRGNLYSTGYMTKYKSNMNKLIQTANVNLKSNYGQSYAGGM